MQIDLNAARGKTEPNRFVLQSRALFNRALVKEVAKDPTIVIPTIQEVTYEACKEFLQTNNTVLWQTFNISSPKGLEDAAQWLKSTVDELYAFVFGQGSNGD
jgi:hypothetical protein